MLIASILNGSLFEDQSLLSPYLSFTQLDQFFTDKLTTPNHV